MTRDEAEKIIPEGTQVWVAATVRGVYDPVEHELDQHPGDVIVAVNFEHPSVGTTSAVLGEPTVRETIWPSIRIAAPRGEAPKTASLTPNDTFLDKYPNHKIAKEREAERIAAGWFLDFIDGEGMTLCTWSEKGREYMPAQVNKDRLIAKLLGIDYDEFNREKDRMLDAWREKAAL